MRKASRDEIANALRCYRKHFYRTPKNAFAPDARRIKNELCAKFGIDKTTMYKLCGRTNFWKIKGTKSRKCTHCKKVKRLNDFPKQGFGWCKKCKSELAVNANRRRRSVDPSYHQACREYHANYFRSKYGVDENYMSKLRENVARRRARLRGAKIERIDAASVYQAKKCYWCGKRLNGDHSLDHVVPISKGGAHASFNVVASCLSCNKSKSAKMPDEWTPSGQLEIALTHD